MNHEKLLWRNWTQYPIHPLQWRHDGRDSVSNHQRLDCLLNRVFRRRSKKTSKLRVTGLCEGNSQGTGEFPVQMASNAGNVSIWWRHHVWRVHKLFGSRDCVPLLTTMSIDLRGPDPTNALNIDPSPHPRMISMGHGVFVYIHPCCGINIAPKIT